MYELNRARLFGIGPRGARYNDVTLDFSGAGLAVRGRSARGEALRPSPTSLLLLENGGGKSVLLTLLFSVMVPGKRNTMGGTKLAALHAEAGTGHVAIEWLHVTTGELLITGKVSEPKTGGGEVRLDESWYSLRPSASVTLETLPFTQDDRRHKLKSYQQALAEAERQDSQTRLVWNGRDQGEWRDHLRSLGILQDLYEIQRGMNVDEGAAAKSFSFKSSRQFIDWLLDAVIEEETLTPVADTFHTFADQLAQREVLLLESEFLDAVAAHLDGLAQTAVDHDSAVADRREAHLRVDALAASVQARSELEQAAVENLQGSLQEAEDAVTRLINEHIQAQDIRREILLRTARLALQDAERDRSAADSQLADARRRAAAWELLPLVDQHASAQRTAQDLAEQMEAADQGVADALRKRDLAAGRLIAKFLQAAEDVEADERRLRKDAEDQKTAAEHAQRDKARAESARATAQADYDTGRKLVVAAEQHIDSAVEHELLPGRVGLDDIASVTTDASEAARDARAAFETAKKARAQARTTTDGARKAEQAATTDFNQATSARQTAQTNLTAAVAPAVELAGYPLIEDLLDTASQDAAEPQVIAEVLTEAAERICSHLDVQAAEKTDERNRLGAEQAEDARVLGALHDAGVLPPRRQATEVAEVLTDHGIAAHPGWVYLERVVGADLRPHVIANRPAAVDGVVIVEPGRVEEARAHLRDQLLLPEAAIWVGPASVLTEVADPAEPSEDGRGGFVVDPTPALYDAQEAERWRDEVSERMSRRGKTLHKIDNEHAEVTRLSEKLRTWSETNTRDHLETLRGAMQDSDAAVLAAEEALEDAARLRSSAEEEETAAEEAVSVAEQFASDARDRHQQLVTLNGHVEPALQAMAREQDLATQIETHQKESERAAEKEEAAGAARTKALVEAERARQEASGHRDAAGEVSSTSGEPAADVPEESIAVLTDIYQTAESIYRAARTDTDLQDQLAAAQEKVKNLAEDLRVKDNDHLAAARALRDEPSAADRSAWRSHATTAREAVDALTIEVGKHDTLVGQRKSTLDHAAPAPGRLSWTTDLPDRLVPTDAETGTRLAREQALHVADRAAALKSAESRKESVTKASAQADTQVAQFRSALELLKVRHEETDDGIPDPSGNTATAFEGDGQAALDAASTAAARLRTARRHTAEARDAQRTAAGQVTRLAQRPRFEALAGLPHRRLLLNAEPQDLARRAPSMAAALRVRRSVIDGELTDSNRHRQILVTQIAGLVNGAFKTLTRASRFSTMPEELVGWGGKRFLRIAYTQPEDLKRHVAETIDRLSADSRSTSSAARSRTKHQYDGLTLLLECLHTAVPRGFRVELLHPDPVLRDGMIPVEEMSDVFSGGQELTAAIVLYCTLAALKADERGSVSHKHSGVLFLDNPIGKANASYLIDVQKGIARALGVQLIYTTGLNDDGVLAAFNVWIKLRNDADLRAGIKYIRIADEMRQHLPEPYSEAELTSGDKPIGTLTAARVARRSTPDTAEQTLLDLDEENLS